jgi:hypothetical protein
MQQTHEWISKAMDRRRSSYGHGGRDRMIASLWSALKGTLESQLRYYRSTDPGSRFELEASATKMMVLGTSLTITLNAESQTIEVSGPGRAATERVFLPMTPIGVERLAQKILEPALFSDQVVTVDFRETAVEAEQVESKSVGKR